MLVIKIQLLFYVRSAEKRKKIAMKSSRKQSLLGTLTDTLGALSTEAMLKLKFL
jgi:hypothetical protein